jgi:hypothetical protein
MPLTRVVLLSFLCFASALPPARANVLIKVDQSNQRMIVLVNGEPRFVACFDGQDRVQHSEWHLPSQLNGSGALFR